MNDNHLPKSVINEWPEIFGDVCVNKFPVPYLEGVKITFVDGHEWTIEVDHNTVDENTSFTTQIDELIEGYRDRIDNVSMKVNTKQIKKDVNRSKNKLLRKLKL